MILSGATVARRAIADQDYIENLGIAEAKRALLKVQQRVLSAYMRGGFVNTRIIFLQELMPVVAKAMTVLHMRGQRLARELRNDSQVKMAKPTQLDKILDKLGDVRRVNSLQKQYETDALRVLNGVSNKVEAKLREKVNELVSKGVPVGKGVKELKKSFDKLGITPKNSFQLETTFRTQSQIAYNAGRWQEDQDPEIQEILWGYEYVTAGDDRVRPEHAKLEGMRLPKNDPLWRTLWPPNGWNCRCTVIPIFETVRIKRPPAGSQPDPGFSFNAGQLLR